MTKTHWPDDISAMHSKFGVHSAVATFDKEKLKKYLDFRLAFLEEELKETKTAAAGVTVNAEEVVDGLIDLCVVAIGTLDAFGVNAQEAWDQVHAANMAKEKGVKKERPNPLGLPDLIKPAGWCAPNHKGNHGKLAGL
jgi:hypothetical protein